MVSSKVFAGLLAGIAAMIFWTVAVVTFWETTFSTETLVILTTSTTAAVIALVAQFVPERKSVHIDKEIADLEKKLAANDIKKILEEMLQRH